ncbi:hypothetical protein SMACR_07570 [Sordaria macrospora]|nr:hypothetical protein SMACR_07570 [Sordaria macrospora]WPJ67343.1 hypothetical protein SMAC4_07570 [Sordaria macrospora]
MSPSSLLSFHVVVTRYNCISLQSPVSSFPHINGEKIIQGEKLNSLLCCRNLNYQFLWFIVVAVANINDRCPLPIPRFPTSLLPSVHGPFSFSRLSFQQMPTRYITHLTYLSLRRDNLTHFDPVPEDPEDPDEPEDPEDPDEPEDPEDPDDPELPDELEEPTETEGPKVP